MSVLDQVTYRVICPSCGAWAQLRIAESLGDGTDPVIVMFSCPNQTSEAHVAPTGRQLYELLPAHPPVRSDV